jgi:hypothetical protein
VYTERDIEALIKVASEEITDEMRKHYEDRTNKHINLVRKYCKKIEDIGELGGMVGRGEQHDKSKLENPEQDPYIFITWEYKCKDDGHPCKYPKELKDKMNAATEHHITHNRHHPEYHDKSRKSGLINRDDRDAVPDKMVDATRMNDLDLAEMVADWCAMSEERGNTPQEWAKKNINKRWKFTKEQEDFIYDLVDYLWDK